MTKEEIVDVILDEHEATIFYNEGDLTALKNNIIKQLEFYAKQRVDLVKLKEIEYLTRFRQWANRNSLLIHSSSIGASDIDYYLESRDK